MDAGMDFFPLRYQGTDFQHRFAALHSRTRRALIREFLGVEYRRSGERRARRMHPGRAGFGLALAHLEKRSCLSHSVWRYPEQLPSYLHLILHHLILGIWIQALKPDFAHRLPAPGPGCSADAPMRLLGLECFNALRPQLEVLCSQAVREITQRHIESLFLICVLGAEIAQRVDPHPQAALQCELIAHSLLPGPCNMGIELEFSDHARARQSGYNQMRLFRDFALDALLWRLGGYRDTHLRLPGALLSPRASGFLEYSLVRPARDRHITQPLSRDLGITGRMLAAVTHFAAPANPHSLHINFEISTAGQMRTQLSDWLCLLILFGDLHSDERGHLREYRLSTGELRGFVQWRNHHDDTGQNHRILEFAFLRLGSAPWLERTGTGILCCLLCFAHAWRVETPDEDSATAMMRWSAEPRALSPTELHRFRQGMQMGFASTGLPNHHWRPQVERMMRLLSHRNYSIRRQNG